jgi:hypothetical protein
MNNVLEKYSNIAVKASSGGNLIKAQLKVK